MKIKSLLILLSVTTSLVACDKKQDILSTPSPMEATRQSAEETNIIEELDPFAPNIEEQLKELDELYFEETGRSPFLPREYSSGDQSCVRATCAVWIQISKSRQMLYLHLNGIHQATWPISTGAKGYTTPNYDTHPNGRIYDKYSSKKFPGGDYKGLGNMPYAIFIQGGIAIHGTPRSNWGKLGKRASHGCIRLHPDNALQLNRLVRQAGIYKTWVTVHD